MILLQRFLKKDEKKKDEQIVKSLYQTYKDSTKEAFRQCLINEIKEVFKNIIGTRKFNNSLDFIKALRYDEKDYDKIQSCLWIYNIVLLVNSQTNERFPFKEVKGVKNSEWSLEHIIPQTPDEDAKESDKRNWLKEQSKETMERLFKDAESKQFDSQSDRDVLNHYIQSSETTEKEQFDVIEAIDRIYEKVYGDRIHELGNLVLLDKSKNSSLGNKSFDKKRNEIIEIVGFRKENLLPVLPGTRWVFFKPYKDKDLLFWTDDDMKNYAEDIKERIRRFLNVDDTE